MRLHRDAVDFARVGIDPAREVDRYDGGARPDRADRGHCFGSQTTTRTDADDAVDHQVGGCERGGGEWPDAATECTERSEPVGMCVRPGAEQL